MQPDSGVLPSWGENLQYRIIPLLRYGQKLKINIQTLQFEQELKLKSQHASQLFLFLLSNL